MFWLCSGEIKSQYPKYCLIATWRVLMTLYFSAIELISPLKKTNCWRIFFPNIDGVKSTSLWNNTKKDNINSSVPSLSHVWLFVTPWTAAHQASLSFTNSQSLLKLMSIELVKPPNHLILCHSLLFPPSIFPSIRVFSNESVLRIRWQKYWSFSSNQQRVTFSLQLSYPPVY